MVTITCGCGNQCLSLVESIKKLDVSHLISPSPSPAPTAPPISLESRPTRLVPYDDVLKATCEFNETSFEDGGHKLGQGGFGQVFYCKMDLGEGMQEIAVKVFSDKVFNYIDNSRVLDIYPFIRQTPK